jgi:hypothetical protein
MFAGAGCAYAAVAISPKIQTTIMWRLPIAALP